MVIDFGNTAGLWLVVTGEMKMNIKEIAREVSRKIYEEDGVLLSKYIGEKFAELLTAEVQRQNVAVAWKITFKSGADPDGFKSVHYHGTNAIADYRQIDPDAISEELFAFKPSIEAEREKVAEACAAYVDRFINGDGILNEVWISEISEAIRSGEWKRYVKNGR